MTRRRTFTTLTSALLAGTLLAACYCPPGGPGPDPTGSAALSATILAGSNGGPTTDLVLQCTYVNPGDANDSSAVCSSTSHYVLRVTNTGDGPTTGPLILDASSDNGLSTIYGTEACASAPSLAAGASCDVTMNLFRAVADDSNPTPVGNVTAEVVALGTAGEQLTATAPGTWSTTYPL